MKNQKELVKDRNLAYVLGAILSDGYSIRWRGEHRVGLKVKDKKFADEFAQRLDSLGMLPVTRYSNNGGNGTYYSVQKCSKYLQKWVEMARNRNIRLTDRVARLFIRGVYDGDGCLVKGEKGYYRVTITSCDSDFIDWISSLLSQLGFTPKIYSRGKGNGFNLRILNQKEVKRFIEEIGSSIPRKRRCTIDLSSLRPKCYSDKELKEYLIKLSQKLGKSPTRQEMDEAEGFPDSTTYRHRFGSWNEAKEKVGLEVF